MKQAGSERVLPGYLTVVEKQKGLQVSIIAKECADGYSR
jgi:hypothetical protein